MWIGAPGLRRHHPLPPACCRYKFSGDEADCKAGLGFCIRSCASKEPISLVERLKRGGSGSLCACDSHFSTQDENGRPLCSPLVRGIDVLELLATSKLKAATKACQGS